MDRATSRFIWVTMAVLGIVVIALMGFGFIRSNAEWRHTHNAAGEAILPDGTPIPQPGRYGSNHGSSGHDAGYIESADGPWVRDANDNLVHPTKADHR